MPVRAGIYCRISDDREGRALGVARQEQDCRDLAARKGWEVVEIYIDNDISAVDPKKRRPEYLRMLDEIKNGRLDALITWDLDRLHRRPIELEEFFDLTEAAGLAFLATVGGDVDLSTGDGLLVARIKGAVAAEEVRKIRQRTRRKARELAEQGKVSGGGSRPFGYDADRVTVREDEAAVVREVAGRVLAGESMRSICGDLDARGVRTSAGNVWRSTGLRRLLVSGRVAGLRDHHGEVVGTAEWPPILAADVASRVRAMFDDPVRRTRRAPRSYLLAGLVRCGHCGAVMVARPRQDGTRRYVCASGPGLAGCGRMTLVAEPLETLVTEAVLIRLDSPELHAALAGQTHDDEADSIDRDLDGDTAQLDELANAYGNREITLREYLTARKPIEARIEATRKRLSRMSGTSALDGFVGNAAELRARWDAIGIDRQRSVIAAVLDHLVIGPGVRGLNRFDPDRVSPVWKY